MRVCERENNISHGVAGKDLYGRLDEILGYFKEHKSTKKGTKR